MYFVHFHHKLVPHYLFHIKLSLNEYTQRQTITVVNSFIIAVILPVLFENASIPILLCSGGF